ncbi:hypothetical protein CBR_g48324 [Chara braunii]|uniref:Imidazoleglycerol-phosphate dehydratase n=1 Tax=Chara braunii TaxID=69332 RepID=A0A388K4B2_CHABU|nr:hypothetical protein CBR_g48324 [Chara braunii]|eukprot:GBG64856.1 hypothetical protein CBR_g48324 [Chara braunii]
MTSAVLTGCAATCQAASCGLWVSTSVAASSAGPDPAVGQSRLRVSSGAVAGLASLKSGIAIGGAAGIATCALTRTHRKREPLRAQCLLGGSSHTTEANDGERKEEEEEEEEEDGLWGDYCLLRPAVHRWEPIKVKAGFSMTSAAPTGPSPTAAAAAGTSAATWMPPSRTRGRRRMSFALGATAPGALEFTSSGIADEEEEGEEEELEDEEEEELEEEELEEEEEEEFLPRTAMVVRKTNETDVEVSINLDGTGISTCDTGIAFLDHMLDQLSSHGLFDLTVKAEGDTHIDDHHSNEDIALALGTALLKALGDRKGIVRFGDFTAPLDEALVHVALDLSGRPHLSCDLEIPTQRVGTYDTQLVEHFFQSLVNTAGMTLHIRQLAGKNSHHIIEATFKAFARALRQAAEADPRRGSAVPSSKGVLSRC